MYFTTTIDNRNSIAQNFMKRSS